MRALFSSEVLPCDLRTSEQCVRRWEICFVTWALSLSLSQATKGVRGCVAFGRGIFRFHTTGSPRHVRDTGVECDVRAGYQSVMRGMALST